MTRRKTDGNRSLTKAHTRKAVKGPAPAESKQPAAGKPGGRLKAEVVLPVGVGALVTVIALGMVAVGSECSGAPLPLTMGAAVLALRAGLVLYVTWVVNSAVATPLSRVRDAREEIEGGNSEVR